MPERIVEHIGEIEQGNFLCQGCAVVYHESYENVIYQLIGEYIVLCDACKESLVEETFEWMVRRRSLGYKNQIG